MIDETNAVVPHVRAGSLDQALEFVGKGPITSFFGRLRAGVVGVDIDMRNGQAPAAELVAWCVQRDLWNLVRRSGRPGHIHVFVVAGPAQPDLERFVADLRRANGVGRTRIDLRTSIRPLSAPHRGGSTPALPRLARAARTLPTALRGLPAQAVRPGSPAIRPTAARSAQSPAEPPATVIGRPRPMPAQWAQYLSCGARPAQVSGWADSTRSAVESTATFHLVRCGLDAQRAWDVIAASDPRAMAKAKQRGRSWWISNVWNRAVADLAAQPAPAQPAQAGAREGGAPAPTKPAAADPASTDSVPAATGTDQELARQVDHVWAGFLRRWNGYGRDHRHTLRAVLESLLERMLRVGHATVPCPERDLVLDTGITSRRVIRAALHRLADDGWLVLQQTFQPFATEPGLRSHHVSLPPTLPNAVALSLPDPPSPFTPLPVGLRPRLGPHLTHLWTCLRETSGRPPAELAASAGLTNVDGASSPAQLRTLLSRLRRLASAGLATCDSAGNWFGRPPEVASPAFVEVAERQQAQRLAQVSAERLGYEQVRARRGRWLAQREQAITRGAAARLLGAQRWWSSLTGAEREHRQKRYELRFQRLSVTEQRHLKNEWASRREVAGAPSEEQSRRDWLASLPPAVLQERVIERTMSFRSLPAPLQAARVAAWAEHRAQWGIQRDQLPARPTPIARAEHAPDADRQRGQWEGLEQLELLALADVLDRDGSGRLSGTDQRRRAAKTRSAV